MFLLSYFYFLNFIAPHPHWSLCLYKKRIKKKNKKEKQRIKKRIKRIKIIKPLTMVWHLYFLKGKFIPLPLSSLSLNWVRKEEVGDRINNSK